MLIFPSVHLFTCYWKGIVNFNLFTCQTRKQKSLTEYFWVYFSSALEKNLLKIVCKFLITLETASKSMSITIFPVLNNLLNLKKLQTELPYDPAIPMLGTHTEETRIERDTCTPMFVTALFIIARTWKQPRCPSADEWIRKLWYIYTMEYHSVIKKNTCESVLMRWMKLELIIQSEVSQKEKHQYSILTHIYGI